MTTPRPTPELARDYVEGVRALLKPGAGPGAERGGGAVAFGALPVLAARVDELTSLSAQLNEAMAAELEAPEPAERGEAASRLLAKALADLEVSSQLAQAAGEADEAMPSFAPAAERGGGPGAGLEETFALILGQGRPAVDFAVRGGAAPADLPSARAQLATGADDTLALITERAARAGQTAMAGLLTIGVAELAKAAAVVGTDLAVAVGQGEAAAKLTQAVAGFAAQAGNAITSLLGPSVAQSAANQVLGWLDELRSGSKLAELLDKLYDTPGTLAEVERLTGSAPDDLARFVAAIGAVDALDEAYAKQIELAEKILGKVKLLALIPVGALPQGRVLMAAIYLALAGYIVLAGADYVDSPRVAVLKRVSGVREVVAQSLADPA
jgi:hypothetical protein